MLIDTHAHVNFSGFKDETDEVIRRALENDVWMINVGSQINTSREAIALTEKYPEGVYAAVGIHPVHTYQQMLDEEETHFKTSAEKFDAEIYRELAKHPKVVGIGECGLDYYRLPADVDQDMVKNLQKESFMGQIKLAQELNKTLIIHSRSSAGTDDACLDILAMLKDFLSRRHSEGVHPTEESQEGILRSAQDDAVLPSFVLHSYTGSWEVLEQFFALGGYVSFNGIITFDKTGNMEKLVKNSPLDRIVLETDCPYLTPVPNRGKKNEPSFVRFVAEQVARLKVMELAEVERTTTANAERLFQFRVGQA